LAQALHQNKLLKEQNAALIGMVQQAAKTNFKLRQEVTGGMQVVWAIANLQPDKKLIIPAVNLVTAMGSLQRSRDEEKDFYIFEAIQPTEEQHQELGEALAQPPLSEALDAALVGNHGEHLIVQDEQSLIVL
jgi:hypothetical protein